MHTNSNTEPTHFTLEQLSAVLIDRKRIPVGLLVSRELWESIAKRWIDEHPFATTEQVPNTFHGLKLAVDPNMPAAEFDVAFTEDAWSKRLREISPTQ